MKERPTDQGVKKIQNNGSHNGGKNMILLLYRWLLYGFAVVLCVTSESFHAQSFAIIESLAVAAIFNVAATAFIINKGSKCSAVIIYVDILVIMLLIYFTGGLKSDLYVFLFFNVGLCGIYKENTSSVKTAAVCAILYSATCIMVGGSDGRFSYAVLVIKDILLLMASFAVSRIYYEVRKFDEMRKKEFRLARTDKLTGLANRHYFEQKLKDEVDYALDKGSVLNVLLFDLDDFKRFNDTYGHVSGDKLLVLFADIIRQCVRRSDIPIRYGGEEFLILIRDLDLILAKSVGDRIRRQLEKQRLYLGDQDEKKRVTASCGIAQFPMHSDNIKEVIEKADQALYHAKKIGKNIVVSFDEIGQARETLQNEQLKRC